MIIPTKFNKLKLYYLSKTILIYLNFYIGNIRLYDSLTTCFNISILSLDVARHLNIKYNPDTNKHDFSNSTRYNLENINGIYEIYLSNSSLIRFSFGSSINYGVIAENFIYIKYIGTTSYILGPDTISNLDILNNKITLLVLPNSIYEMQIYK